MLACSQRHRLSQLPSLMPPAPPEMYCALCCALLVRRRVLLVSRWVGEVRRLLRQVQGAAPAVPLLAALPQAARATAPAAHRVPRVQRLWRRGRRPVWRPRRVWRHAAFFYWSIRLTSARRFDSIASESICILEFTNSDIICTNVRVV